MSPLEALQDLHPRPSWTRVKEPAPIQVVYPAEGVLAYTAEKGWHGLPSPPAWWWTALEA